jgi:hypothetical protein
MEKKMNKITKEEQKEVVIYIILNSTHEERMIILQRTTVLQKITVLQKEKETKEKEEEKLTLPYIKASIATEDATIIQKVFESVNKIASDIINKTALIDHNKILDEQLLYEIISKSVTRYLRVNLFNSLITLPEIKVMSKKLKEFEDRILENTIRHNDIIKFMTIKGIEITDASTVKVYVSAILNYPLNTQELQKTKKYKIIVARNLANENMEESELINTTLANALLNSIFVNIKHGPINEIHLLNTSCFKRKSDSRKNKIDKDGYPVNEQQ